MSFVILEVNKKSTLAEIHCIGGKGIFRILERIELTIWVLMEEIYPSIPTCQPLKLGISLENTLYHTVNLPKIFNSLNSWTPDTVLYKGLCCSVSSPHKLCVILIKVLQVQITEVCASFGTHHASSNMNTMQGILWTYVLCTAFILIWDIWGQILIKWMQMLFIYYGFEPQLQYMYQLLPLQLIVHNICFYKGTV